MRFHCKGFIVNGASIKNQVIMMGALKMTANLCHPDTLTHLLILLYWRSKIYSFKLNCELIFFFFFDMEKGQEAIPFFPIYNLSFTAPAQSSASCELIKVSYKSQLSRPKIIPSLELRGQKDRVLMLIV